MDLAKPGKTRWLTSVGTDLARQDAAAQSVFHFWNWTEPVFCSQLGPLAGYPDPLLTLGECDSEIDSDVVMCVEDIVDALDGVHLDGDENMEMDVDVEEEQDEEEQDEEKEDKEEENQDEEEDKDEDDGKEPRMIGQGESVNTFADNVDTMVDNQPIVLPEQDQVICKYTQQPQPPASAPLPYTPDPCPSPWTPETHPICSLQHLGIVTPQNLVQRCQLCVTVRQPETPQMWMWITSCSVNREMATVILMSLCPMSYSPMHHLQRHALMAQWVRSQGVLPWPRRRWFWCSGRRRV